MIYSWGYGCNGAPSRLCARGHHRRDFCNTMQVPGPTLIVTEGPDGHGDPDE